MRLLFTVLVGFVIPFIEGHKFHHQVQCDPCERGWGLVRSCGKARPTVCELCIDGYFTPDRNHWNPCRACSICPDGTFMETRCTNTKDTKCSPCDASSGRFSPDFIRKCVLVTTPKPKLNEPTDSEEEKSIENMFPSDFSTEWDFPSSEVQESQENEEPVFKKVRLPGLFEDYPSDLGNLQDTVLDARKQAQLAKAVLQRIRIGPVLVPKITHLKRKKPSSDSSDEEEKISIVRLPKYSNDWPENQPNALKAKKLDGISKIRIGPQLREPKQQKNQKLRGLNTIRIGPPVKLQNPKLPEIELEITRFHQESKSSETKEDTFEEIIDVNNGKFSKRNEDPETDKDFEILDELDRKLFGKLLQNGNKRNYPSVRDSFGEPLHFKHATPLKQEEGELKNNKSNLSPTLRWLFRHPRNFGIFYGAVFVITLTAIIATIWLIKRSCYGESTDWNTRYQNMQMVLSDSDRSIIKKCAENIEWPARQNELRNGEFESDDQPLIHVQSNPMTDYLRLYHSNSLDHLDDI